MTISKTIFKMKITEIYRMLFNFHWVVFRRRYEYLSYNSIFLMRKIVDAWERKYRLRVTCHWRIRNIMWSIQHWKLYYCVFFCFCYNTTEFSSTKSISRNKIFINSILRKCLPLFKFYSAFFYFLFKDIF